jgi:hypothetical protein
LWRTPDAGCARGAQSKERFAESAREGRLLTLNDQVAHLEHLLPTPKASDANKTTRTEAGLRKQEEGYGLNLPEYAQMFPTPRASDADKGTRTEAGAQKELNRGHGVDLPAYIQMYPTPTANDAKNNNSPSQSKRHSDALNVAAGGSLNPGWVSALMGFPPGWLDADFEPKAKRERKGGLPRLPRLKKLKRLSGAGDTDGRTDSHE